MNLYEQSHHRMGTSELNRAIEEITAERGPSNKHGKHARIYYATQVEVAPPTVTLFVNDEDLFNLNWQQYLVNRMRERVAFSEVPIKLNLRGKEKLTAEQRQALKFGAKH
jgi:GTP-binding protein